MKTLFLPSYINKVTCDALCLWTLNNPDALRNTPSKGRLISKPESHNYPDEALGIHSDLKAQFPILESDFRLWHKGILTGAIHPKGVFEPHVDTNYKSDNKSVVGFNLLVSQPEGGGILTVDGHQYEQKIGDMTAFLITDYYHSVSEVVGNIPRVMWYWRFYVDKDAWENQ